MAEVGSSIAYPDCFFINGEWVPASGDKKFNLVNPSSEEIFLQVAEAGKDDVAKAVAAARMAFDKGPWPWMTHAERGAYLNALADVLSGRVDEIALLTSSENGSTLPIAKGMAEYATFLYQPVDEVGVG